MSYNGWKNYETWNVNLWLNSHEALYKCARLYAKGDYRFFAMLYLVILGETTPDGVAWLDESLDYEALDEMLKEMSQ